MHQPLYTVGIQRWPLPVFKKHRVVNHMVECLGGSVRVALVYQDGSTIVIPGLDRKKLKIYPDYHIANAHRQALAASQGTALQEIAQ